MGVIIGSLFIIIMFSIGQGMDYYYETQVMQQGSMTTITVNTYGDIFDDDGRYVDSKQQKLDENLLDQIKQIKHVKAVTPVIQKNATLYSGRYQGWTYITAMDWEVFEAFDFPKLTQGVYPNDEDNSALIFGFMQPYEFYDTSSWRWTPVTIDINKDKLVLKFEDYQPSTKKKKFTVPLTNIAKMEETKADFDYNTYMDLDYFKEIYMQYCNTLTLEDRKKAIKTLTEYQQIRLNVDSMENVEEVQDKIQELGFLSSSNMQFLKPPIEASKTIQMVFLVLGAVSMFISAISIANTMVMAIYERTKEIGIMKVLGCVIKDIKKLFLFEAGMIGFFGGIIGIGLGYLASLLINKYGQPLFNAIMSSPYMMSDTGQTKYSIIPFYLPFITLAISTGVGIVFGYFPARRATKISSIEAMKSEG